LMNSLGYLMTFNLFIVNEKGLNSY
jgi:hypothetical protein